MAADIHHGRRHPDGHHQLLGLLDSLPTIPALYPTGFSYADPWHNLWLDLHLPEMTLALTSIFRRWNLLQSKRSPWWEWLETMFLNLYVVCQLSPCYLMFLAMYSLGELFISTASWVYKYFNSDAFFYVFPWFFRIEWDIIKRRKVSMS